MNEILVVGGGMVGSAICHDLMNRHRVVLWDVNDCDDDRLLGSPNFSFHQRDLFASKEVERNSFDLIVLAVPGFMGFKALEHIIPGSKRIVDISFFPEDATELHDLSVKHGSSVVVDAGVAPGFSNIVLGYHGSREQLESFKCLVGGLPKNPVSPWNYKAPFSPIDVIEEYTRPARFRRNGEDVILPALSEVESFDTRYGSFEAFNSDGLRSLLKSFPSIPNMVEKTVRYPGHAKSIQLLADSGFFGEDYLESTSGLLLDQWKLGENEDEFTLMQIDLSSREKHSSYLLYDERDAKSGFSSMSRTTGYTCTATAEWLLNHQVESGILPPEILGGQEGFLGHVLDYLRARGILIEAT